MADEYIRREDAIRAVTPQYAPAINYALITQSFQRLHFIYAEGTPSSLQRAS